MISGDHTGDDDDDDFIDDDDSEGGCNDGSYRDIDYGAAVMMLMITIT